MTPIRLMTVALIALLGACSHPIKFEQVHYSVPSIDARQDATVAIPTSTRRHEVVIRSFMTGIAHAWQAQAGEMLRQVAEIELPQMLGNVTFTSERLQPAAPAEGGVSQPLSIVLTLNDYQFADFGASVAMRAQVFSANGEPLLDRIYMARGDSQGGKMFWGGAFGMKSAVRQSSLDAFQDVFRQFRDDLAATLVSSAQPAV